ncbi:uncharacterized protein LOC144126006 isoform X2 [Amblyomma americanum]
MGAPRGLSPIFDWIYTTAASVEISSVTRFLWEPQGACGLPRGNVWNSVEIILLKFKRKNRYKKAALAAPRHFCTKAVVIRLRWLRRCAFRHPKMTTESTLSGSASPDCGDQQDPYQVLDDLRHAAMENVARQQLAIKQETERLRRELNELRRDTGECGQLLPVQPEDVEKLEEEIQESFVCGTADAYKIEDDLHEAHIVCKIVRQRVQAILKDVAEVDQICDNLVNFSADSDDDEELGSAEGEAMS